MDMKYIRSTARLLDRNYVKRRVLDPSEKVLESL